MFLYFVLFLVYLSGDQVTSQTCQCFVTTSSVNIRDAACGNVIGSGYDGQCYPSTGNSQPCDLDGTPYTYVEFEYGGGTGWSASDFMEEANCPVTTTAASTTTSEPASDPGVCANVVRRFRADWGARPPNGNLTPLTTPVKNIYIHHTVTASCFTQEDCEAEMRSIQDYHIDGRGYTDIGYSWLVGEDGQAYEGRGWPWVGAHTQGCNSVAVAISLIGNFEPTADGTVPNNAIIEAARNLIDCAVEEGILVGWDALELRGHQDSPCAATACPGQYVEDIIRQWPWFNTNDPQDPPCVC